MAKHSPTPWHKSRYSKRTIVVPGMIVAEFPVGYKEEEEAEANAERTIVCVNGCEGFTNPTEGVPAVLEALRAFVNLYGAFTERLSPREHAIVTEGRAALYALDERE